MKIEIGLPHDNSIVSLLIYEGLFYLLSRSEAKPCGKYICLDDETLRDYFKSINSNVEDVTQKMRRLKIDANSKKSIKSYLEQIGVDCKQKYKTECERLTTSNLIKLVTEKAVEDGFPEIDVINIKYKLEGTDLTLDLDRKEQPRITWALLKTPDRYTGLNIWENMYLDKQRTTYVSWRVFTIILVGLISSYITSKTRAGGNIEHAFLFFSPSYLAEKMWSRITENINIIRYISMKELARDEIAKTYIAMNSPEIVGLHLMLETKLRKSLEEHNLDRIDLLTLNIVDEGRGFKRYNSQKITLFKKDIFAKSLEIIVGRQKTEEWLNRASEMISPNSGLFEALKTLQTKNPSPESEKILHSLLNLYFFITTGNKQYYFNFKRNLTEAAHICSITDNLRRCRASPQNYEYYIRTL